MAREPTIGELADDMVELRQEFRMLNEAFRTAPYVRRDLHDEQIANLRNVVEQVAKTTDAGISRISTQLMWVLGIMGSLFVAAMVAVIANVAGGGA